MDINKLTAQFQQDLAHAQSLANGFNHSVIEALHVLSAMVGDSSSTVSSLLSQCSTDFAKLKSDIETQVNQLASLDNPTGDINISQNLLRLLNQTDKLAIDRGDSYLTTELFLLAIIKGNDATTQLLKKHGVNEIQLTTMIENLRGGETVNDQNAETQRDALDKYTTVMASLILSLVVMVKSVALFKCCNAEPRTTQYSLVSPVWEKPPLPRVWRNALLTMKCLKVLKVSDYYHSIWLHW